MAEKWASRKSKSPEVFGHPPRRAPTPLRAGLYARVSTQDQQTIPANLPKPLRIKIRGLTPCGPLLISQGHNGVRLRRAACRNVAGEQRDSGQGQRDRDERQRVGGLDAVQQAGQEAGQS